MEFKLVKDSAVAQPSNESTQLLTKCNIESVQEYENKIEDNIEYKNTSEHENKLNQQRELRKQRELEKQRNIEREIERERMRKRDIQRELEREHELERQRQRQRERERENMNIRKHPIECYLESVSTKQPSREPTHEKVIEKQLPLEFDRERVSIKQPPLEFDRERVSIKQPPLEFDRERVSIKQPPLEFDRERVSIKQPPHEFDRERVSIKQPSHEFDRERVSIKQPSHEFESESTRQPPREPNREKVIEKQHQLEFDRERVSIKQYPRESERESVRQPPREIDFDERDSKFSILYKDNFNLYHDLKDLREYTAKLNYYKEYLKDEIKKRDKKIEELEEQLKAERSDNMYTQKYIAHFHDTITKFKDNFETFTFKGVMSSETYKTDTQSDTKLKTYTCAEKEHKKSLESEDFSLKRKQSTNEEKHNIFSPEKRYKDETQQDEKLKNLTPKEDTKDKKPKKSFNNKAKLCYYHKCTNPTCEYAHSIDDLAICPNGENCKRRNMCPYTLHSELGRSLFRGVYKGKHESICKSFYLQNHCNTYPNCNQIHYNFIMTKNPQTQY
jgi:hypothetical protein